MPYRLSYVAAILATTVAFIYLLSPRRTPAGRRLTRNAAMLMALVSFTFGKAKAAESVGGACLTGADTVSNGVALTCVSNVWAVNTMKVGNDSGACDSSKGGAIRWTGSAFQYCDGSSTWTNAAGGGGSVDQTPVAFAFTDLTSQTVGVKTSNILQITGIDVGVAVNIAGDGSPQYRICSNSSCTSVLTDWTSNQNVLTNNQYLQLRTTPSAGTTTYNVTASVGSVSDIWSVSTLSGVPSAYAFTDLTSQGYGATVTSNTLTLTNAAGADMAVSITGAAGSPQFRINSGSYVTSGTLPSGGTLQLKITAASAYSTARTATVTVQTVNDTWSVTTEAPPPPPYYGDGGDNDESSADISGTVLDPFTRTLIQQSKDRGEIH